MEMTPESSRSSLDPPRQGLAIASLVLGILALFFSLIVVGAVLGIIGLALGLAHQSRKRGRNGMALWGASLSVLAIIGSLFMGVVYFRFYGVMKEAMSSMQGGAEPLQQWEGVLAPDFTVTTLEGKTIRLSELRGKRVVLDFWATWCGPCVHEVPEFIRLQNETSHDQLTILGISDEDADKLKAFAKQKGVNYAMASAKDLPTPFSHLQAVPTTFFIDRGGVIQAVAVGTREYAQLRELALAKDTEGEPKHAPAAAASGLKDAEKTLAPVPVWSTNLPGAMALSAGDWDGAGQREILVAAGNRLHVFGVDGTERGTVALPEQFTMIECGHDRQKHPMLLGYSVWGRKVEVLDNAGKELWSFTSALGVDGAHWGDLDGNGADEMVVGMNGFSGLEALTTEGKELWQQRLGNVWSQAVISAENGQPSQVFASEAGGSVRVYDGQGQSIKVLRPNGAYCTRIAAGRVRRSGQVQLLVLGQGSSGEQAIALDPTGQVAWSAPVLSTPGGWGEVRFACGDVLGDGDLQWAFIQSSGELALASSTGQRLAVLPNAAGIKDFILLPDAQGRGLLVTLRGAALQAYSFAQAPATTSADEQH